MQQKLCLWLCLAVLLGALCLGNPFLRDASAPAPKDASSLSPVATPVAAPAGANAVPHASPAGGMMVALDGRARADNGARRGLATPAMAVQPGSAVDAVSTTCPDAALAELVVATSRTRRGEIVWHLQDGRRVKRNARSAPGQPLVVALDDDDR